jgi:NAD(P)-dependent dehydrogenase (short-subunit alcohol dehydrogenase family)
MEAFSPCSGRGRWGNVAQRRAPAVPPAAPFAAGMQHVASVQEFDLAAWNRVLNLNLTAGFLLSKALLPAMLSRVR